MRLDKIIDAPAARTRHDAAAAERDFADIWLILWHRRVFLAAVTALVGGLALLYCLTTPRLYASSAQILIDPRDRQVLAKGVTPDTLASDGGVTQVESQVRVLQSDVVLLRAVKAAGLASDAEFGVASTGLLATFTQSYRDLFGLAPAGGESADLRALRALKRRLSVKRADKVFVIDVTVTADTGEKAARIAEAVAQAYLDDQAQARAAASNTASNELTGKLADLRTQVRDAENAVEAYKSAHDIVGAGGRLVKEQQLTDTNNQLATAHARTLEARARFETIDRARRSGAATTDALQSPNMLQLRAQYAQVTRQRADLGAQLGSRHPAIVSIDAQVADVRRLIAGEIDRIARAARSDVEQAEVGERSLRRAVEDLSRTAQTTGLDYVRLRELERQAEASRAVYEAYLVRARETGEQAGISTVNARIITHAVVPIEKSWPPTLILLLAALGGGFGVGAAAVLLGAHVAPVLISSGQVRQVGDLPVIAVGPVPGLVADGAPPGREPVSAGVSMALAPLRNLILRRGSAERPAVILLEGDVSDRIVKTRLARVLAASAAAQGARILLVDGDFTTRRLSSLSGEAKRPGLLDLLRGRRTFEQVASEDPDTGVVMLGAGLGDSIVRPLPAADLQNWLGRIGRRFDAVIVDCGGATQDVRTASLAVLADEHLAVVRAGQTSGRSLQDLVAAAAAAGHPFSGVVYLHADRRA